MTKPLELQLDRTKKTPLADQICMGITAAIESGVLTSGARLPSWVDLAVQLGVARGTVRAAYDKLSAAQLIVASRATGTRVTERPRLSSRRDPAPEAGSFMEMYQEMTTGPAIFQMGVPAKETFPAKLLARIRAHAIRVEASAPALYPDPRGELELRREIAAYLAIARGIECSPSQVLVTGGFGGGLGLVLRVLGLEGRKAWFEEPGFPFTRRGLELAQLSPVPVPVDSEGIDVDYGLRNAPDAGLAVVTPGQQAPLGTTLSLSRRLRLLEWASLEEAWVIEDDYLSELQLTGRAAPALASVDRAGRVIHIGSFSKTISPTLRLGFVLVPQALVSRFAEVAACLAPPPGPAVQLATAEFIAEGHYLRHLRRTKRAYAAQRDALLQQLEKSANGIEVSTAGLAILHRFTDGISDISVVRETLPFGLAPAPLSVWYSSPGSAQQGLLLGIATCPQQHVARSCDRLLEIIYRVRSR
ncbi:MocR-like pyridoxine biosynthesis transcription factor PdxR [Phyllobacterium lublinensis]|uniref:MocR-like pyridoxine biosynthesis transcription factor PdxR n=1 Tax=Phyllobacterium lublinensis TaxID=2875708 RepID=UPI001CCE3ABC|nr:PLP-dependent aminotransferase family protein [Phyllobacterium sp. 2063]MBZ9654448.1 PLP-dependent aminotransferase family protein [Phyllobacterium sp. 2063]